MIVDYNSWVESDEGRRLANSLDKDVVLAEGGSLSGSWAPYPDERLTLVVVW